MKIDNSKARQRHRLEQDMKRFLEEGGQVKQVPRGMSGADPLSGRGYQTALFSGPKQAARTDLSSVAAELDARKKRGSRRPTALTRRRRKLIYDDFGEPLRWVWEDSTRT